MEQLRQLPCSERVDVMFLSELFRECLRRVALTNDDSLAASFARPKIDVYVQERLGRLIALLLWLPSGDLGPEGALCLAPLELNLLRCLISGLDVAKPLLSFLVDLKRNLLLFRLLFFLLRFHYRLRVWLQEGRRQPWR